jgi:hypothetical protein
MKGTPTTVERAPTPRGPSWEERPVQKNWDSSVHLDFFQSTAICAGSVYFGNGQQICRIWWVPLILYISGISTSYQFTPAVLSSFVLSRCNMKRSRGLRDRLGLLLTLGVDILAGSPPISVSIQATWQEPPMLIQVLWELQHHYLCDSWHVWIWTDVIEKRFPIRESAALERPGLFFSSIDAVCSGWESSKSKLSTDQQTYEYLTSLLRSPGLLDGPGELESLAFSIALKEAQPKIEAFRVWYASLPSNLTGQSEPQASESDGCKSWTLINNSRICDTSKLSELLDSHDPSEKWVVVSLKGGVHPETDGSNLTESNRNLKFFLSIISRASHMKTHVYQSQSCMPPRTPAPFVLFIKCYTNLRRSSPLRLLTSLDGKYPLHHRPHQSLNRPVFWVDGVLA